jgi:hypothetical protein
MPSPSMMMTFLVRRPWSSSPSPSASTVDETVAVPVASVKVAVSVCRPGAWKA